MSYEIEISTELYAELETHAKAEKLTVEQFIDKLLHLVLRSRSSRQKVNH